MKTSDLQCPDEIARVDLARSKKTKMSQQKISRHNHIAVRGGTSELTAFTIARHTVACERHPDRNEDCIIADEQSGLAAVFDGVGGSAAGEIFFFSSRRRHTRCGCDWSSDVCSSDLRRRECWKRLPVDLFRQNCSENVLARLMRSKRCLLDIFSLSGRH